MKRIIPFFFLIIMGISATAQNISVKSFQALPMDMTASSLEGKRIDQNNEVAALIKIVTSQTGFTFEAGALGIVDSKQETGEVWVWVPRGSRKITIKHQQLGVLREYRYPIEIQSERTYEMVLVTGTVETVVKEKITKQFLAFQVTPPNATLEVNDQIWDLGPDGTAQKFVDFGTYTYRVQAPNYHPDAGRVIVNDLDNTQKEIVTLKPNFGWIEVAGTGNLQGASVYIDNVFLDKAPCKSGSLKSGTHSVRITKDMYQPYSGMVEVKDNETASVAPSLMADFAEVTLEVDADAEIWVNNELKGIRTWTGPLSSGSYKVECKMANHENSLSTQEITSDMAGQTLTLPAPTPIYGSLTVESTPTFASVFIDGKAMGETPKFFNEILVGQHEIKVTKDGYVNYTETVTVAKGENKQVKAALSEEDYNMKGIEYYKKEDYAEAMKWFLKAAEQGNRSSQANIGTLYYYGYGVEEDYTEAMKWFRKAAEQGNTVAQYNVGEMYYYGKGVEKDYVEAAKWFRKAAEQGSADGQSFLGYLYQVGQGVTQDYGEAMRWLLKAAEQGNRSSQANIGTLYYYGYGVEEDYTEAMKWFRKAAEQGNESAQNYLGKMYENGYGVTKDLEEAKKWYRKAAEQGHENAQKRLKELQ